MRIVRPIVVDTPPASDNDNAQTPIVVHDDSDDSDDERLPILNLAPRPTRPSTSNMAQRTNQINRGPLLLPTRPYQEPPAARRDNNETPQELARQLEELNTVLADHQCSICQDVFKEPVNLPCGMNISHTVCKADVLELQKNHPNCPLCRASIQAWLNNITSLNANDFVNVARNQIIKQTTKR